MAAYENPLIPNARLREIYVAMTQARVLGRHLAGRRGPVATAGMEAALVGGTIDLGTCDLVSHAIAGGVVDYLAGAPLASVLPGAKAARRLGTLSGCGAAGRLPPAATFPERMWSALGAAAALKAAPAAGGDAPKGSGVVVAYLQPAEATGTPWGKVLRFAADHELPILFAVLPGAGEGGRISAASRKRGVPGIAVDGDDAVAIYRVAQESIVRARAGGGAALMECVPFRVPGAKPGTADALKTLDVYLMQRKVATRVWIDASGRRFAARLGTGPAR